MNTNGAKPLLAVVYDLGAVDPVRISSAARPLCDVVFVLDRGSAYVDRAAEGIAQYARTVDVTGLDGAEAARRVAALGIAGVLTFSEYRLGLTSLIAEAAGVPFHSPDTVRGLTDKFEQRRRLTASGVQATGCVVVRDPAGAEAAAEEVGLPAVVKPRTGAGSVDTCRAETAAEAGAAVAAFLRDGGAAEFVVEEMLVGDPTAAGAGLGDYVSVESVHCGDQIQTVCVTGKFALADPFRETGYFMPSTVPDALAAEIVDVERRALRALGVDHGITHTEVKLTPEGPRVIEVNGRLGGYVGEILQRAAGIDLVRTAVRLALGEKLTVPRPRWRQVAYQYFLAPPAGVEELVSLTGVEEVNEVDGVHYLDLHTEPGSRVHWRAGTRAHLGIVYGSAPDHDRMRAALKEIDTRLRPVYR
ncbi:ATP-grasp domain-containing protein [Streptomyces zhaozhouensis]|uniref:ATP-grasp domain-containing protein n=1 Tax=Streptomyces zhaozhouensis TaxID=1300267 RepID=A0A286DLK0_9ACTN|nr:ATP-grasp domain-containing protein [Streptomyces zhaozhouensis]SOD59500.1 ATP-grasp domain-containing protein [Streptomyces zhaozhouensis]